MKITLPITLDGKTLDVDFELQGSDQLYSQSVFASQIGNGVKFHRTRMMVVCKDTKEELAKLGYARAVRVIEQDGKFYGINLTANVRNSHATIVGFAEDFAGSDNATKQDYYGSL